MTPPDSIEITPTLLVALAGFVTAVVSVATQWRAGVIQARKDEVTLLRDEINRLNDTVKTWERKWAKWQDYVGLLQRTMRAHNLIVPPEPNGEVVVSEVKK